MKKTKLTYKPRHLRRARLSARLNSFFESDSARAAANVVDWLTRIAWLLGGVATALHLLADLLL